MMRFRPRFSVRTLAILVTLVCAYFGSWEVTKRYAVQAVWKYTLGHVSSPMPFVIREDFTSAGRITSAGNFDPVGIQYRHYSIWLFGPTINLPHDPRQYE